MIRIDTARAGLLVLVMATGCGSVTSSQLATDAGDVDAGGELGAAGAGGGAAGAAGGGDGGRGGRGGAAPWGPAAAAACKGELFNLTDCSRRIDGWQCAQACVSGMIGGPDLAAGGACVANGVTYCVPPRDGGDACAACTPP